MQERHEHQLASRARFGCSAFSCLFALHLPLPAFAAPTDESGRLTKAPGLCRARDDDALLWFRIGPNDPVRAGMHIVCNAAGSIAYTLPGNGALVERSVTADEEVVVARGRGARTVPEGTRPGLRASASPLQLSPAEQLMRSDSDRLQQMAITAAIQQGAMMGAALGALLGKAEGATGGQARRQAGVGAVAGGMLAGVDGYVIAKKEQAGPSVLLALEAAAADVRGDNSKLQAFRDSSAAVTHEGKIRLAEMRADLAALRIDAEQAELVRRREVQNIDAVKQTLMHAKGARDQYTLAAAKLGGAPLERRKLDVEIARMSALLGQVENSTAEYERAVAASRD